MRDYLDRINKLVELENITVNRLETIIGASKNVLQKSIKNKTDIQTKWLIRIAENFPRYSLDWLLVGRGEMLVDENSKKLTVSEPASVYKISNKKEDRLLDIIESQQRTIENLSKRGEKGVDSA